MPRKHTRKAKGKKGVLSIPELRRSFEHIETFGRKCAHDVMKKKMSKSSAAEAYAKEWKRTFGRTLPAKSALSYIEHLLSVGMRGGSSERSGSQTGGMAPVGWSDTQPGVYAAPTLPGQTDAAGYTAYGSFPNYVEKGFDAMMWKDGLASTCGKQDSFPMPAADLGNNAVTPNGAIPVGSTTYMKPGMAGGRRRRTRKGSRSRRNQTGGAAFLAAAFRPFDATNPTGVSYDMTTQFKGMGVPASPDPTQPAFQYNSNFVKTPDFGNISAINRDLYKADITSTKPVV